MAPLSLFYCYAHEDEALRDQLEKHLAVLQREGLITGWHDRKILTGESWADEMERHLQTASIILLLISADFLASDACYESRMQRTLERHKRRDACVVPIILRPCDWQHSPVGGLQCLPRSGEPVVAGRGLDAAFFDVTEGLRELIEQQQGLARSPRILSPQDRQNRMRLLKQVQKIWIEGLLKQSLHNTARIELRLQDRPDVLQNPWRLQVQELSQAPQELPNGTTLEQVYDKAEGELLILGKPGSGKTTLLLELAQTLLERAEKDEHLRMPVVFNLSSWAEQRLPLHVWLVEELWMKYQVPRKIGQGWVDGDQVLPLLDGLDEVTKDARSACVEVINAYYQSRLLHGGRSQLVVCCRSEEYAELSTRVMLSCAVSILPLTDEQIAVYLEQAGEQVRALRQWLSGDAELHRLACQPLMLNIFTLAYQGAQSPEMPTGAATQEERQRTIFSAYVERMLRRREQSRDWKPEQIAHWLSYLARQMREHNQTIFYLEHLQPDWLPAALQRVYIWLAVRLPSIVIGILASLIMTLLLNGSQNLTTLLQTGVLGGLIGGLFSAAMRTERTSHTQHHPASGTGHVLVRRTMISILIGLVYGLSFEGKLASGYGPYEWLRDGSSSAVVIGLSCWVLMARLPRGLSRWTELVSLHGRQQRWQWLQRPRWRWLYHLIRSCWRWLQRQRWQWLDDILDTQHGRRALLVVTVLGSGRSLSFAMSYGFRYGFRDALSVGLRDLVSYGLLLGLTSVLISIILARQAENVRLVERLRWTWKSLMHAMLSSDHLQRTMLLACPLTILLGLRVGFIYGLIYGSSYGLSLGLIYGLIYWLLLGLFQSIVQEQIEDQDRQMVNQGIYHTSRTGGILGMMSTGIIGIIGIVSLSLSMGLHDGPSNILHYGLRDGLSDGLRGGLSGGLHYWLLIAVSGGVLIWTMSGGLAVLRHAAIRILLQWYHTFPYRVAPFLEDARTRILLHRIGGGYSFTHRLLLDHFADAGTPVTPLLIRHQRGSYIHSHI